MRETRPSAASCTPPTGDVPATKLHVPDRNQTWGPLVHRLMLYPLSQTGNIFVVSLAVADLVVAVYPYPLVLTSILNDGWTLGYLHCQVSGFLMGLSVIGSIFNITGIAINRYCYICHSLRYDRLYSNKNSVCCVLLIWVLTLAAIAPNLRIGTLQYDPRIYSCTFAQSVSSAYTIAVVVFHFLVPMVIVVFCYLRIWILVLQVRRRVKPDHQPKLKPQDFRNFVTMFVVFVLFAICWAPLNLIGLAVASDPAGMVPRIPEPELQEGVQEDHRLPVHSQDVLCGEHQRWRRQGEMQTLAVKDPQSSHKGGLRLKNKALLARRESCSRSY
ncbi:Melatonin receptor type 1A [Myotis davidii]|uniref:Melatonin receptor type 1A n=1 Tax=Myotis davidii TaxID=225400 RepID=L5LSQ6_MYODS|nr:Melatonin receptor type 1A [Myotis davidii]